MSSERAGVHTSADAVLDAIRECAAPGMELRYDGSEDPVAAAYVAGVQTAHEAAKGTLEASEQPGTGGTLDREKAEAVLQEHNTDPQYRDDLFDALEACVVRDPRLARIEAALAETETMTLNPGAARALDIVAQIIRGEA